MDFDVLRYINNPNFCKCYSKYHRLKHGAVFLLCLFEIENLNKYKK